jgi:hypothetical protein
MSTGKRDDDAPVPGGGSTLGRGNDATVRRSADTAVTRPAEEGATRLRSTRLEPTRTVPPAAFPDRPAARAPVAERLAAGYRLRDRYVLDTLIGQGAMGQVWRAKDLLGEEAQDRNPFVAVKVLTGEVAAHPEAFIALHREAARGQKLAHPNIVTVHIFDRDEPSGRAFIAMELLQGQPLDRVIREAAGGLPRKQALPIIRAMAEGLAYAHRRGLVHSDFKPANVFLTSDGVPKILDFGIARAVQTVEGSGEWTAALDQSGFQGYTAAYAPPEVLAGTSGPSTADDVFALGLTAYELLTGAHAFQRHDALEAEGMGLQPPSVPGLSRREARTLARAVSFERNRRPKDATAFLRELQGVPLIQKVLVAAVATLILAAAGLWYARYLDTLPAQPLEALPAAIQHDFHAKVDEGNDSLAYMERTGDITASADAAQLFAEAYRLHPKDPLAVKGLTAAADKAIEWYGRMPDRTQALEQLKNFRAKSEYYQNYAPLVRAITAAGGE